MNWLHRIAGMLLLAPACLDALASDCVQSTRGIDSMHRERILLDDGAGTQLALDVLVADDGFERASGFQHVCPAVIDATLILFRYPAPASGQFHMQNVHAPLDIAFFDDRGQAIEMFLMATYRDDHRPLYGPGAPFLHALEAPAGFFAGHGLDAKSTRLLFP